MDLGGYNAHNEYLVVHDALIIPFFFVLHVVGEMSPIMVVLSLLGRL